MYTAAVLDGFSQRFLEEVLGEHCNFREKGYVFKTNVGVDLPHHMTINLGSFDSDLNPRQFLNASAILRVERFLYDDDICAAEVATAVAIDFRDGEVREVCDIYTINDERSRPHITMCLRPPARPVQSNHLFAQDSTPVIIELEEPIVLVASIRVCS